METLKLNEFESLTKDPVCGALVNAATALYEECDGNVFYFCSFFCRHKFVTEPFGAAARCENSQG